MDNTQIGSPHEIRKKLNLLSECSVSPPPAGMLGVVINIFSLKFTDEQRRYILWWLLGDSDNPKELSTKVLTAAQKQALIDWVAPKRFEVRTKKVWLPQPNLYQELNLIWYEVWKTLMIDGMIIEEKIYTEV